MSYSDDIFSQVAGVQHPDNLEEVEAAKQSQLKIAGRISEMSKHDGWKDVLDELESLEKRHSNVPSVYSNNPTLAHIDTGALAVIEHVRVLVESCKSLITELEYETSRKNGDSRESQQ